MEPIITTMFCSDYISLEAIAAQLNLPATYLKRLVGCGKLPCIDIGNGRLRFQEESVRTVLKEMEYALLEKEE